MTTIEQHTASYTIQCVHPETGKTGCWVFSGQDHRQPGTSISPFFPDIVPLHEWLRDNGWEAFGCLQCRKLNPPTQTKILVNVD